MPSPHHHEVLCPRGAHNNNTNCRRAGVFRLRLWRFGQWTDVLVDDHLPTLDGRLVYCPTVGRAEFWGPLVEKAYAK